MSQAASAIAALSSALLIPGYEPPQPVAPAPAPTPAAAVPPQAHVMDEEERMWREKIKMHRRIAKENSSRMDGDISVVMMAGTMAFALCALLARR